MQTQFNTAASIRADRQRLAREMASFLRTAKPAYLVELGLMPKPIAGAAGIPCRACGQPAPDGCWNSHCPEGLDNLMREAGPDTAAEWSAAMLNMDM